MKWEPLFAHLLKLFMRTDKLKKEDSEKTTSVTGDGQKNEPAKDSGGQNINMTNNNRSSYEIAYNSNKKQLSGFR